MSAFLSWQQAYEAGPLVCGGKGYNLARLAFTSGYLLDAAPRQSKTPPAVAATRFSITSLAGRTETSVCELHSGKQKGNIK